MLRNIIVDVREFLTARCLRKAPVTVTPRTQSASRTGKLHKLNNNHSFLSSYRFGNKIKKHSLFLSHISFSKSPLIFPVTTQLLKQRFSTMDKSQPKPEYHRIDFKNTPIPEYQGRFACIIKDVLSISECDDFVRRAEATAGEKGWELAQVNVGGGLQETRTDIRNSSRIMWDNPEEAEMLLNRIRPFIEKDIGVLTKARKDQDGIIFSDMGVRGDWELTRLNERLRFLKYKSGEYFKPHCDGAYSTPDRSEMSFVTFQLYLRDPHNPDSIAEGGPTRFWSYDMKRYLDVPATPGSVLVFQHAALLHSGEPVTSGIKIAVRTDFMYKKKSEAQ